ncbi:hypothetical protein GCM10009619_34870 [Williamsia maris]
MTDDALPNSRRRLTPRAITAVTARTPARHGAIDASVDAVAFVEAGVDRDMRGLLPLFAGVVVRLVAQCAPDDERTSNPGGNTSTHVVTNGLRKG